jgi:hypothetical protein
MEMKKCIICKKDFDENKDINFCSECIELIQGLDLETLNEERKWQEDLFIKRYSNFLIVFSLIITAGFANNIAFCKSFIFYLGAFLLFMCWMPIVQAYKMYDNSLNIILNHKFGKDDQTVFALQKLLKRRKGFKDKFSISKLMAFYIPIISIVSLITIGSLLVYLYP